MKSTFSSLAKGAAWQNQSSDQSPSAIMRLRKDSGELSSMMKKTKKGVSKIAQILARQGEI